MRLEANSVEPGAVRLIITRHAYAKKPRMEPGEDGDEVIYISGGTELVSRRKDSRPGVWLPRKHDEKKKKTIGYVCNDNIDHNEFIAQQGVYVAFIVPEQNPRLTETIL